MGRAEEIADDLIGTARSLHDAATDAEMDDYKLLEELYGLAFECDCCGWWASTEELNDDSGEELCDECNKSRDDP